MAWMTCRNAAANATMLKFVNGLFDTEVLCRTGYAKLRPARHCLAGAGEGLLPGEREKTGDRE